MASPPKGDATRKPKQQKQKPPDNKARQEFASPNAPRLLLPHPLGPRLREPTRLIFLATWRHVHRQERPSPRPDAALRSHLSQRLHPFDQRLAENKRKKIHLPAPPIQNLHPTVTAARRSVGYLTAREATAAVPPSQPLPIAPPAGRARGTGSPPPSPKTHGGFEGCAPSGTAERAACLAGVLNLFPPPPPPFASPAQTLPISTSASCHTS